MHNSILNANYYGLSIFGTSSDNIIHHNGFVHNNLAGTSQGYDEGMNNIWFDNSTKEGNFWSDYSGIGNYSIDGPSNSQDPYALSENPTKVLRFTKTNDVIVSGRKIDFYEIKSIKVDHYNVMLLIFSIALVILLKNKREYIITY
jgi:hypothetical protein